MHDIVKCARCKKTFIGEAFDGHVCTPQYRGSKRIMIDFHTMSKDERGRVRIMAKGMDGITYWLTVSDQPSMPIPLEVTKRKFTEDGSNDGLTVPHLRVGCRRVAAALFLQGMCQA